MPRPLVALVTEERFATAPPADDPHTDNVLLEDRILGEALGEQGIDARRVDWACPRTDWSTFDAALIRTPWNYFERLDGFRRWLDEVSAATTLLNPRELVLWNLHKGYLGELGRAGVPVVDSVLLPRGSGELGLAGLMAERGWDRAVVKPAVSAGAWETYRVEADAAEEVEARMTSVGAQVDLILQPFVPSIVTRGEVSLMIMDGELTHAVRKVAAPGDFRVQDDHGGTVHAHGPTGAETEVALGALAALPHGVPLYARVDLVTDEGGEPRVMEVELIEPELWLRFEPRAAQPLARGLRSLIA